MSFLETPRFPACPSFGYTSTPDYSVTISEAVSGKEWRNRNWARPRFSFDCTIGPRAEDDIQELTEFWHALGGPEVGFRFQDLTDYKSCFVGDEPTSTDQLLEIIVDSPSGYQLSKAYTAGARTQLRPIYKPVQGTILLADNGVAKTEGAQWQLDYATGIVTLSFSPVGPLTWGGEFDVPVRFDSRFPVEIQNKKIHSVAFALKELRDPVDED